jgi:hypothetical protein
MSRERIIDFAQQLSSMLQHINKARENLNQGRASKDLLAGQGAAEEAMRLASQLADGQRNFDKLVESVAMKSKRPTIEGTEELLTDIGERLKIADAAYAQWRQLVAQHDVNARTGEYDRENGAENRRIDEERMAQAKKEYDSAVEAADALVPSPGVIQLL